MRAVVLLLYLSLGVLPTFAQQFRIATWQVQGWPSLKPSVPASQSDEEWYARVAATLNAADADAILLYGVPDKESSRKLAGLLKPHKYSVAHESAPTANGSKGPFIGEPFAVFSRKERMAGRAMNWMDTGRIEPPGGFSFVTFRQGPAVVALYVATMPGSWTNDARGADLSYYARKRSYAAQYLAHHSSWITTTYTNATFAIYLTGDLAPNPKGGPDDAAKVLERGGFRTLLPGVTDDKLARAITNSSGLDRVLDPVFTRGVEFVASRQISRAPPEFSLLTCDLTLKPPTTAALGGKGSSSLANLAANLAANVGANVGANARATPEAKPATAPAAPEVQPVPTPAVSAPVPDPSSFPAAASAAKAPSALNPARVSMAGRAPATDRGDRMANPAVTNVAENKCV